MHYCFFVFFSTNIYAQDGERTTKVLAATDVAQLLELAQQHDQAYHTQYAEAFEKALEKNWTIEHESKEGTMMVLDKLDDKGKPIYLTTDNSTAAALTRTDFMWPSSGAGINVTGLGMVIGVWESGSVRTTHQEFSTSILIGSRVVQIDFGSTSDHATHVAGTIAAGGLIPSVKGMAYEAFVHAYRINNDESEMATFAADGRLLSNHSYSDQRGWHWSDIDNDDSNELTWQGDTEISDTEDYVFGFYSEETREWDEIAYLAPYYLIVTSAGNERDDGEAPGTSHYVWDAAADDWVESTDTREDDGGEDGFDSCRQHGVCKNVLTVGAIDSDKQSAYFSSWGPTDDGRIKPDLVGLGVDVFSTGDENNMDYSTKSGTSMSTPNVSGSLLLLQQYYESLNGDGNFMKAATLKGLAIHTAEDIGRPGPDYEFGWGLLNTFDAALFVLLHESSGELQEEEFSTNENYVFETIVANSNTIKATLSWTDVPATPPAAALNPPDLMLVNDLDMSITTLDGSTMYLPYILDPADPTADATTGDNIRDNIEHILITDVTPGDTLSLIITHKNTLATGSQPYSFLLSGASIVEDVVGIDDNLPTINTLTLSPNPTKHLSTIRFQLSQAQNVSPRFIQCTRQRNGLAF